MAHSRGIRLWICGEDCEQNCKLQIYSEMHEIAKEPADLQDEPREKGEHACLAVERTRMIPISAAVVLADAS
jgi:hypothetical protein